MTALQRPTRFLSRRAALVLAASGALGFFVGAVLEPTWQDVIEPGQVLAGRIHYAADNPVFLYSTRAWTVLHQFAGALLAAGLTERTLAIVMSGIVGMVSFQALGMTVFAMSDDVPLAAASPFFIYFTGATWGGIAYPVLLSGAPYTSGIIGLSYLLLVCALVGAGEYAVAALLLGFMPAVHVTLGLWCCIIVGLTALGSGRAVRMELWRARGWFIAGAALAAISGIVQFVWFRGPAPDAMTTDEWGRYLSALMTYWDAHRRPFERLSIQQAPFLIGLVVAGVWLRRLGRLPALGSRAFLPRAVILSAFIGTALSLVLVVVPDVGGGLLWRAMPSRLMNLPILACMAMIVGIAGWAKAGLVSRLTLAALVVTLSVVAAMSHPSIAGVAPLAKVSFAAMAVAALLLAFARPESGPDGPSASRLLTVFPTVVLLVFAVLHPGARFITRQEVFERAPLADTSMDEVFAAAAGRPGSLLTAANIHLVQMRARRPVVLDGGAIDALPYVPAAAPATERILRDLYGVSLLRPRFFSERADGALPMDAGRLLWESRSAEEWATLADEFGFNDVLTYSEWRLRLPRVARAGRLTLYAIPDSLRPSAR